MEQERDNRSLEGQDISSAVIQRGLTRRDAVRLGGIAALGLTFSKPLIQTIIPKPAFAAYHEAHQQPPTQVIIEAEDMDLTVYVIDPNNPDWIRLPGRGPGYATATFPGISSTYQVSLSIVVEWDGRPSIDLWIGGAHQGSYQYPLGTSSTNTVMVIPGPTLPVNTGDLIGIVGHDDAGAWARFDKITFTPA